MPIKNRLAELLPEIADWRHTIHANPELMYDLPKTTALVEAKLREFGVDEIVTGIGRSGIVGLIKGKSDGSGRCIGLRADMDALPMTEDTGLPYASETPGKMH
ncbi:MAG: amidohydrolase, partial [Pseudomonadota bacterium]